MTAEATPPIPHERLLYSFFILSGCRILKLVQDVHHLPHQTAHISLFYFVVEDEPDREVVLRRSEKPFPSEL